MKALRVLLFWAFIIPIGMWLIFGGYQLLMPEDKTVWYAFPMLASIAVFSIVVAGALAAAMANLCSEPLGNFIRVFLSERSRRRFDHDDN